MPSKSLSTVHTTIPACTSLLRRNRTKSLLFSVRTARPELVANLKTSSSGKATPASPLSRTDTTSNSLRGVVQQRAMESSRWSKAGPSSSVLVFADRLFDFIRMQLDVTPGMEQIDRLQARIDLQQVLIGSTEPTEIGQSPHRNPGADQSSRTTADACLLDDQLRLKV